MTVIESEFRSLDATDELFQLRDDGSETPTLVGHFAVFDEWTEINSRFEGQFLERIAPGAFDKTFAENRRNMRVLFQHGRDANVGEQPLGSIEELRSEPEGAYYEVGLFRGVPQLILDGLEAGVYGASFRFRAMKEDWNDRAEESDYNPTGMRERTITEAKVMEFGPVTFPAYEGASAGLRSITDWWIEQDLRRQLEALGGNRAAALAPEVKLEATPNFEPSRRTRVVDHLSVREEEKPWRL
jgi:HK97 family phage prohead protease